MNALDKPISTLAEALAHAQYEAFSEISYMDRDWEKYHKWKQKHFNHLSREEKAQFYEQERAKGQYMGPADCLIPKTRRPGCSEIDVLAMFPQLWSSTALGFGGLGGQAITTAYTIVIRCNSEHAVYFGGRHAYTINNPNEQFWDDVKARHLKSVADHTIYQPNE